MKDTDVDKLLGLINKKKEISLAQASKELKDDKKLVLQWAKLLEEEKLIIIQNKFIGDPILKKWKTTK